MVSAQQLSWLTFNKPAPDWKESANRDHQDAELQRLRMGQEGCGCNPTCQDFYKTINLTPFGDRVKTFDGMIFIAAGATGADLIKRVSLEIPQNNAVAHNRGIDLQTTKKLSRKHALPTATKGKRIKITTATKVVRKNIKK